MKDRPLILKDTPGADLANTLMLRAVYRKPKAKPASISNPQEERSWWERAAENGYVSAMARLGVLAEEAGDMAAARSWWERAAENGHARAMFSLGVLAEEAGDMAAARTWWERAAENGYARAMFELGSLAKKAGDEAGARTWWERAAEKGDPNGAAALAKERGEARRERGVA